MATYSSHRHNEKSRNLHFFFSLNGDIWNFSLQKCLLSSLLCFITFVQIGVFDWLTGRPIFVKMLKNLLLRNHKEDEAKTWHTCLGHYPLQKFCFSFRSDKNSGCYGNL